MTIDTEYKVVLEELIANGQLTKPRGMITKELIAHQMHLPSAKHCILTNKARKPNYAFMVAEWLWIMFGCNDTKFIGHFNKNILNYSDDGRTFYGAYGPHFTSQLYKTYETLRNDPDSRQAVISIWIQNPIQSKDIPCTISFQFLIRDGYLHTLANMRSNDVFLGLPYDTFNFCQIGNLMANMLDVKRGTYTLTAGSLHIYKEHFDKALDILECEEYAGSIMPTTNDIDIFDMDDYIRAKDLFTNHKNLIVAGTLKEDIIDEFPHGIKEHIRFLNAYASRTHKENEFWKVCY